MSYRNTIMKHRNALWITLFITIFFSSSAFSQKIWDKYSKLSSLSADFKQIKEVKSLGVTLKSEGSLNFQKPDFFEWQVKKPRSFGFVFRKGSIELWENGKISKSADSSKMDAKMLNAISHLKAWLTLDQKFIESHYSIKELSKNRYEFRPIGELKIFKSITIETHEKYPIKKIQMLEMSDDVIDIEFFGTKMTYEK